MPSSAAHDGVGASDDAFTASDESRVATADPFFACLVPLLLLPDALLDDASTDRVSAAQLALATAATTP